MLTLRHDTFIGFANHTDIEEINMISSTNWFTVSTEGLKQLQQGKPKQYALLLHFSWGRPMHLPFICRLPPATSHLLTGQTESHTIVPG